MPASEEPAQRPRGTFVCGVINDIHSLGLFIVMQALRRNGHTVVNLGTMISAEDFVAAARETAADALIVSNSSGMGELELAPLVNQCREAGLKDLFIYAGGMLTLRKDDWPEIRQRLEALGIRRAFAPGTSLKESIQVYEDDLALRAASKASV